MNKQKEAFVMENKEEKVMPMALKEEMLTTVTGGTSDGKELTMELPVSDTILISKYSGTEVKNDGTQYTVLRQSDEVAKVY
ncbi:MAG: co-chaperone GroES [Lachnospiraceae bacterium]|nr:co-chaperone GroES [Lachnospiraceae bacterium]